MRAESRVRRSSANNHLVAGIAAAKRRQIEPARRLLRAQTTVHPEDERGWLWLATVAQDPYELRRCLERVLEINPGHPRAHGWLQEAVQGTRASEHRVRRCLFCDGLSDRGRCQRCGCVQTFAKLGEVGQRQVDEEVVTAAISRLRLGDIDTEPCRRHLELALAYLNLGQPLDGLFQLRLAARINHHPPLRKLIVTLARRYER